jgi:hypothetical protein
MKKKIFTTVATLALTGLLAFPSPILAQSAGGGTGAAGMHEGREHHPALRQAIKALERAKYDLNHANHDFGGHRAEALEACDNAIKQLNVALQYDKK